MFTRHCARMTLAAVSIATAITSAEAHFIQNRNKPSQDNLL